MLGIALHVYYQQYSQWQRRASRPWLLTQPEQKLQMLMQKTETLTLHQCCLTGKLPVRQTEATSQPASITTCTPQLSQYSWCPL